VTESALTDARARLTYVVLDFPIASEQFLIREVKALLALGAEIQILALRSRPGPGTLLPIEGTKVDRPKSPWSAGFWLSVLTECARHPRSSLELVTASLSVMAGQGWLDKIRTTRLALVALHFTDATRINGSVAIHAHFASAPATLGLLLSVSVQRPFSFSTHAGDLYAERVNFSAKAARASCIFTCSKAAAADLRNRLPVHLRSRVLAMYHGIELAAIAKRPVDIGLTGHPLILAVGRFVPKKGFRHLVQACAWLRDEGFAFQCELVGEGSESEALRDQIRALRLSDRVRLVQWCPQAELAKHYFRASVLAVPSVVAPDGDRDNIPNVILEALAQGIPVVASALPAIDEVLGPTGAAILVPPHDVSALAAGIRQICMDQGLARRLRERGLDLVAREFDLHANARRLLEQLTSG
jgi:glycosyltransferase involved in cell wall biosynthesis